MNQSVIFNELVRWVAELEVVEFTAQQQGSLIRCQVSRRYLQQFSVPQLVGADDTIEVFEHQRFDLEEMAEALITEEAFDSHGDIFIG